MYSGPDSGGGGGGEKEGDGSGGKASVYISSQSRVCCCVCVAGLAEAVSYANAVFYIYILDYNILSCILLYATHLFPVYYLVHGKTVSVEYQASEPIYYSDAVTHSCQIYSYYSHVLSAMCYFVLELSKRLLKKKNRGIEQKNLKLDISPPTA